MPILEEAPVARITFLEAMVVFKVITYLLINTKKIQTLYFPTRKSLNGSCAALPSLSISVEMASMI